MTRDADDTTNANPLRDEENVPLKRKRGRPRKKNLPAEEEQKMEEKKVAPKRKAPARTATKMENKENDFVVKNDSVY